MRPELALMMAQLTGYRLGLLIGLPRGSGIPTPLVRAWECPRCYGVTWDCDGTPRCGRCGFWETAS